MVVLVPFAAITCTVHMKVHEGACMPHGVHVCMPCQLPRQLLRLGCWLRAMLVLFMLLVARCCHS